MAERTIQTKLKFDGEKEYKEACKGINNTLKVLSSELKVVSAEYAGNEKSAEALQAKQDILKRQFDEQTKKVEENEKALASLKAQENQNVDAIARFEIALNNSRAEMLRTQNEINKLDGEIENAKKSTDEFTNQLDESEGSLKKVGDEAENTSEKLTFFSEASDKIKIGLLALGTAVVAGFGAVTKIGTDYTQAMNNFITQTSLGKENSEEFGEVLKNIYGNNYGDSMEDVADAMAKVAQNAKDLSPENIEKMTTSAIVLRDTFDYDVSESMRAVNMLVDQFGISGEEAFNLIAQGTQNGLNKNEDLLDSINEYSVHYQQLGFTAEEFFSSLANGTEAGTFSVDKLGDAMKEFGIIVHEGSDDTKQAFADLGLDADATAEAFAQGGEAGKVAFQQVTEKLFEMEDATKKNQLGVALFGTMWEDLGVEGVKALTDTESEIKKNINALEEIDKIKYDDLGSAFTGIGRMLTTELALPISEKILPKLDEFANKLADGDTWVKPLADSITKFVGYVVDNFDEVTALIAGVGTALAVFNVASVVMKLVEAFKAYKAVTEGATIAQWLLNAAMSANPIGLVVSLIAGLVAGVAILIASNDELKEKMLNAWESLKVAVTEKLEVVKEFFAVTLPETFNTVINFVKENWQGLLLLIVNPFAGAFKLLYDNSEGFKSFIDNFVNTVVETVQNFGNNIVTVISELPSKIQEHLSLIINNVTTWTVNLITTATTEIPKFINTVITFISELPNKIQQHLINIVNNVIAWVNNLINTATTEIPKFVNKIVTTISELPNKIQQHLTSVVNNVVSWGNNMVSTATTHITNFVNAIITKVTELPSKVSTKLTEVITTVTTWGTNMVSTATTSVTNFITAIITKVTELPTKFSDELAKVVQKVTAWGTNMVTSATTEVKKFTDKVIEMISTLPSDFMDIGIQMIDGVWEGIKSRTSYFTSKVKGFFSDIVSDVKETLDINSPSRVFAEIGGYMAEGLDVGFTKQMAKVNHNILNSIPTDLDISNSVKTSNSKINAQTTGISSGVNSNMPAINVIQNFYTPQYDYAGQQKEATKQLRMLARTV